MGPNKEKFNPFGVLSDDRLRQEWEEADETPGERVVIRGFGNTSKGELYLEIARRVNGDVVGIKPESRPKTMRRRKREVSKGFFHPIDGSRAMRDITEEGLWRARLRR